ncbi:replication protein [Candidatus Daviesbacteria bacterium]|nr:replication protein [Candidatus Daviesbacteria bacterium]
MIKNLAVQYENPSTDYFKVRNSFAEALARINTSEYETRLLWVIIRKTWGWNKDEDYISVTQFEKATGINRSNAHPSLLKLEEKKIIIINRTGHINKYRINTNVNEWVHKEGKNVIPINNVIPADNIIPPTNTPLFEDITTSLSQETITKETEKTIKQNTSNINSDSIKNSLPVKTEQPNKQIPLQKLVSYYKQLYKGKFNHEPVISSMSWGKWGKLLKTKLEQGYSLKEIAILLQTFAKSKESDPKRLGFDLGAFFSDYVFNKMQAIKSKRVDVATEGKYDKY